MRRGARLLPCLQANGNLAPLVMVRAIIRADQFVMWLVACNKWPQINAPSPNRPEVNYRLPTRASGWQLAQKSLNKGADNPDPSLGIRRGIFDCWAAPDNTVKRVQPSCSNRSVHIFHPGR